jgi:hypothetical protein
MSNWDRAITAFREGFLLTPPRELSWTTGGLFYVDGVAVSQAVYDLAEAGELAAARALWLAGFENRLTT